MPTPRCDHTPPGLPSWARDFQFLGGSPCRTCGGPMTHEEVIFFAYDCRSCDRQKPGPLA